MASPSRRLLPLLLLPLLLCAVICQCAAATSSFSTPSASSSPPAFEENIRYVTDEDIPAYELYNQAIAAEHRGDPLLALSLYERSLLLKPSLFDSLLNLGTLLDRFGEPARAAECYEKLLSVPDSSSAPYFKAGAANNLGHLAHKQAGKDVTQLERAIVYYELALSYVPDHLDSLYNSGKVLSESGRHAEAVRRYERVLELHPKHLSARLNLANEHFLADNSSVAVRLLTDALEIGGVTYRPGQGFRPLSGSLDVAGDTSKAPADMYNVATLIMVLNNLGQVYRDSNMHDLAFQAFEGAFYLSGGTSTNSAVNMHIARRTLNNWADLDDRVAHFLHLFTTREVCAVSAVSALLPSSSCKAAPPPPTTKEEEDELAVQEMSKIRAGDSPALMPYDSILLSAASPLLRLAVATLASRPYENLSVLGRGGDKVYGPKITKQSAAAAASAKLRIAYISYDFRDHPMGHLTKALVTGHDPSRFGTVALSYGPNDSSTYRRAFESGVELFLDAANSGPFATVSVPDSGAAARALHDSAIDICVDLMAHTRGSVITIPALKPCAVLVNYLGYPGTTGAKFFDYAMVDSVVAPPEAQGAWSEKLVYLPHTYQSNDYNLDVDICTGAGGDETPCDVGRALLLASVVREGELDDVSKRDFSSLLRGNLRDADDDEMIAICNFNTIDKLEPVSFTMWMNILVRAPNAKLFLLRPQEPLGTSIVQALLLEAALRGVHKRRIVFVGRLPRYKNIARISGCDAFVDTLTYGAHTTMSDFLWAATPSFTVGAYGLEGKNTSSMAAGMASRVGGSFLKNLLGGDNNNLSDLFVQGSVKSLEDHVSLLGLEGRRKGGLKMLRSMIAKALLSKPHFDSKLITENAELAFRCMWEVLNHGRGNMHIIVAPETKRSGSVHLESRAIDEAIAALGDESAAASAIAITRRLVASFPDSPDALQLHAMALRSSDTDGAISHMRRAIELSPTVPFFHANLGSLLASKNATLEASESYTTAFLLDPISGLTEGHGGLALQYLRLLDVDTESIGVAFGRMCAAHQVLQQLCELADDATRVQDLHTIDGLEDSICAAISSLFVSHAQFLNKFDPYGTMRYLKVAAILTPYSIQPRLKFGASLERLGDGGNALKQYFRGAKDQYLIDTKERRAASWGKSIKGRPTIAIYCNEYGATWWPNWSWANVAKGGLGGSEEAVVFMTRELAKLGYSVTVYNEVRDEEAGLDPVDPNVRWLHYREYDAGNPPDVFVAWRYHVSLALAGVDIGGDADAAREKVFAGAIKKPRKTFLWLQDVPPFTSYTKEMCRGVDGIFVLSDFHTRYLPDYCQIKAKVTPNGIDLSQQFAEGKEADGANDGTHFVYGSAPNRGLEPLLDMWPAIYSTLKKEKGIAPTLHIYYGFSKAFIAFGKSGQLGDNFEAWMAAMMDRIQTLEGVVYRGMVNHEELARGYASAGFILYPTTFPETGCVTLMKAMAAGCIPITSRYHDSTLPELTEGWDLGPTLAVQSSDEEARAWRAKYIRSVVDAVLKRNELGSVRFKMKAWARERFSWRHVAALWHKQFA